MSNGAGIWVSGVPAVPPSAGIVGKAEQEKKEKKRLDLG